MESENSIYECGHCSKSRFSLIDKTFPEVVKISGIVYPDNRGTFEESYNDEIKSLLTTEFNPCQDNISTSVAGVFRGLHWQLPPYAQAKLVHCVKGLILDVFVDLRKSSKNLLKSGAFILHPGESVFVPAGFAHGFLAMQDSIVSYKVDNPYNKEASRDLNIQSFTDLLNTMGGFADRLILSDKDQAAQSSKTLLSRNVDLFD